MHAVCGYPVKSTWLKAIKAGNYVGWPMLNEKNVKKYYPETNETPQGHMVQSRKGVRSTKAKPLKEQEYTITREERKGCLYSSVRCKGNSIYRSNRSYASLITKWKQILNGNGGN